MVDLSDVDFAMRMRNHMERGQDVGGFMDRPHWLNQYIELVQRLIAKQEGNG